MSPLAEGLRSRIERYAQQASEGVDLTTERGVVQSYAVANLKEIALLLLGVAARGEEALRSEERVERLAREAR